MAGLRIALLVSSMGGGGAERVATTLANAWVGRGYDVVLVPTYLGARSAVYEIRAGVELAPLAALVSKPYKGPAGWALKLHALRQAVGKFSPDVVISFLTNVNVTAIAALCGDGRPLVISERADVAASVELPGALRVARQMLYQFADVLVVQTSEAMRGFRESIFRAPRTAVIPNPLPAELHASKMRASQSGHGGEIVAMGRLTAQKRFDHLILAFDRAFASDPSWTLTILGEGPLRGTLQSLIETTRVRRRISLPGTTTLPWDRLAAGQIFALSSAYEGFPNAMLEAMALGLPCVAYDCPTGPKELAAGGAAALLVPSGDIESLAAALRALADDPRRREGLGDSAAESVRRRFSEAEVLRGWDDLFSSILN